MVHFEVEIRIFTDTDLEDRVSDIIESFELFCGVKALDITQLDKYKNDTKVKPKNPIDNPFLQVEFLLEDPNHEEKHSACEYLCTRWLDAATQDDPENPWLMMKHFAENPNHRNVHEVVVTFSMGILCHSSRYYSHVIFTEICGVFYHDARYLRLYGTQQKSCSIEINYGTIKNLLVSMDHGNIVLLLYLTQPPLAFSHDPGIEGLRGPSKFRKPSFSNVAPEHVGKTTAICITFSGDQQQARDIIARLHHRCNRLPVAYVSLSQSSFTHVHLSFPHIEMDNCFPCLYTLHAMVRRNYVLQLQGINDFLRDLKHWHQEDIEVTHTALAELFKISEQGALMDYRLKLKSLFHFHKETKEVARDNENRQMMPEITCLVRRAVVTPTRVLLWPPEPVLENRVLRKFDAEYALRVTFRDDDYRNLNLLFEYSEMIYDKAIRQPLKNGIKIGSREYKFLAWSNSQLRAHGVWMYAQDEQGNDVVSIREWMGDFSDIHIVPKRMSRMGQCFSHTQDVMEVPLNTTFIETIDDIMYGHDPESKKPYCFSDGVGKISQNFAVEVCNTLKHKHLRSAYQIRYAGYKGMLVLDPTLKDVDIVFRKSMLKFDCPKSQRLEIVKVSQQGLVYLNRPLINLLNQLDVPDRVFLMIQEENIRELIDMLLDGAKAAAYLSMHTSISKVDFLELAESGIDLSTEPFFKSLLVANHHHAIRKIKNKANLAIEPNQGRNMFGVLDETGSLEYGQVFVQYTVYQASHDKSKSKTGIIQGTVVVTKNPCLSAGDVRKLEAVDIPELHHIVDCIVFPQKGDRPHPNEMGGADLDGDEYSIIWQHDLLFPGRNCRPQQFPIPEYPERYKCGKNMEMEKAVEFFCDYIKNDKVGIIASAHLALSDLKRRGIFDRDCTHIARLFSIAVDFAKNGQEVRLRPEDKPGVYPDFMQNRGKKSYRSRRALGKLYRNARDFDREACEASSKRYSQVLDPSLEVPGWKEFEDEARESKTKYTRFLLSLMHTYGVQHESELISGAFSKLHYRHYDRKDQAEVEQLLALCVKSLWTYMGEEFLHGIDMAVDPEGALKKASAWYMVSYSDEKADILSFPWVASHFLAMIKQLRLCQMGQWPCTTNNQSIQYLESKLSANMDNLQSLKGNLKIMLTHSDVPVVETVARLLITWGRANRFLKPVRIGKVMIESDIIELFSWFVEEDTSRLKSGPADLLLYFIKLCMTFRFKSKAKVKAQLGFPFPQCKNLGRHAMLAYHHIALNGSLKILGIESDSKNCPAGLMEMEPMHIPIDIRLTPVSDVERCLKEWSEMERVDIRKDERGIFWVSAIGTPSAVGTLESILQKGTQWISESLQKGYMLEDHFVPL